MSKENKLFAFLNQLKNIFARYFAKENANYLVIKKACEENNKFRWRERAEKLFLFNNEYYYCGKKCTKEKAVAEFERSSGFKLNELIGGKNE